MTDEKARQVIAWSSAGLTTCLLLIMVLWLDDKVEDLSDRVDYLEDQLDRLLEE
jgi:hypothetical protein